MAVEIDLRSDEGLRAAIEHVGASSATSSVAKNWYDELRNHLSIVREGIPSKLEDAEFLERLWEDEAVTSTGMGSVKVGMVRNDPTFKAWFAAEVAQPLPEEDTKREQRLISFYNELVMRSKALAGRTPILKINRVLAALYPAELTTLADVGKLKDLHRAMGGSTRDHVVTAHRTIRSRIEKLLGPASSADLPTVARRMSLPWFLYELVAQKPDEGTAMPDPNPQQPLLTPLPAIRRRKGLLAIAGLFPGLVSVASELKEGLTRDELFDYYRRENPDLKDSTLSTVANALCREFDIAEREGDRYQLSARGLSLLESGESDELADYLLTHILGVDNVIVHLRSGPQTRALLRTHLRSLNPGWTSNFAPDALVSWLRSMGVLDTKDDGRVVLTERGERWSDRIGWTPEGLKPLPSEPFGVVPQPTGMGIKFPPFESILERLQLAVGNELRFENSLVAQLHAGLWAHQRRHFAVLTGLSGSGKTQLALRYALALVGRGDEALDDQVLVVPVQPGWYDPTPLLGYVNPLESGYRTAPFLEFLQDAADDSEQPYVVILDEMNLSHPEQYLAPILSAMEMPSGKLDLHRLGAGTTATPERVLYPSNVAIIGTVNNDETTRGLSDKVLDRAFTLEFWNVAVNDFPGWGSSSLPTEVEQQVKELLVALSKALSPVRMHFGYRVIHDVLGYLAYSVRMGRDVRAAMDEVIYARVLPKLRGEGSTKFTKALKDCVDILANGQLGQSRAKVQELLVDVQESGTAKFWR
jgi:hypothetical protein